MEKVRVRRVFVTLEVESATPLPELRRRGWWQMVVGMAGGQRVLQATANVARAKEPRRRGRR
jgi:hypothetical protein